ncbi:TolC family protein [Maribacter sp. HTCC2170]|uniref:TolC family protein n=1 Tax=Maribacter sp. (strain HTCC2170 / KCCM 42371) TaxID=313603 RepID=UPI00006BD1D4|nr:TolC family protein [Maribacter sp. HTCC2170]EAR02571.1 outer membrane efflux protein, putative [Maribacter sp. HTCC2170]
MKFRVLILILLITGGLYAQEQPSSFTLDEAIVFALENNYTAINAGRDIVDAQKQKWETIADGLPQISGAISYQNQLKQPVSLLPGEIIGGDPGTYIPIIFSQPQQASATATLRQQIFDGSYIVGVQATKTFLNYSANNKEKTDLEVRKSVVEAYGNVLLANESVSILEKNLVTLEKNLFETTKIFENGLGDEESVEQLQITLSSIETQLKHAIRLKEITLQMLNLVMGISIDSPTQLTDSLDNLTLKKIDLGLLDSAFSIENNVDYKLAANLNQQRALELKLAKSRALPTLNAFVNYGSSSFSDSFNFLSGDPKWFNSSIMGFDLNIPIFSSLKRSASTQRAKIALEKAKTQFIEAQEQIRLQLDRAKSDYILAIEQYETSKQNLGLAERIESKNQIKYFEGLASSFELRQAQTQLYTAQQEYLQSMVEVINKKTALETIMNNKS